MAINAAIDQKEKVASKEITDLKEATGPKEITDLKKTNDLKEITDLEEATDLKKTTDDKEDAGSKVITDSKKMIDDLKAKEADLSKKNIDVEEEHGFEESIHIKAYLNASKLAAQCAKSGNVPPGIVTSYQKHKTALYGDFINVCQNNCSSIPEANICGIRLANILFHGAFTRKLELRDLVKRMSDMMFAAIDVLVRQQLKLEEKDPNEKRPEYEARLEEWKKARLPVLEKREGETFRTLAFFSAMKTELNRLLDGMIEKKKQAAMVSANGKVKPEMSAEMQRAIKATIDVIEKIAVTAQDATKSKVVVKEKKGAKGKDNSKPNGAVQPKDDSKSKLESEPKSVAKPSKDDDKAKDTPRPNNAAAQHPADNSKSTGKALVDAQKKAAQDKIFFEQLQNKGKENSKPDDTVQPKDGTKRKDATKPSDQPEPAKNEDKPDNAAKPDNAVKTNAAAQQTVGNPKDAGKALIDAQKKAAQDKSVFDKLQDKLEATTETKVKEDTPASKTSVDVNTKDIRDGKDTVKVDANAQDIRNEKDTIRIIEAKDDGKSGSDVKVNGETITKDEPPASKTIVDVNAKDASKTNVDVKTKDIRNEKDAIKVIKAKEDSQSGSVLKVDTKAKDYSKSEGVVKVEAITETKTKDEPLAPKTIVDVNRKDTREPKNATKVIKTKDDGEPAIVVKVDGMAKNDGKPASVVKVTGKSGGFVKIDLKAKVSGKSEGAVKVGEKAKGDGKTEAVVLVDAKPPKESVWGKK